MVSRRMISDFSVKLSLLLSSRDYHLYILEIYPFVVRRNVVKNYPYFLSADKRTVLITETDGPLLAK